jgi:GAF domain-containing protein
MFREGLLIKTLVQLADNLVDDFDVVDVLTTLSDRCVDILDVSAAGVMLVDQADELQVVASSSEAMRILELFELQASQGPCVDCYGRGEPIVNEALSAADGRWPAFTPRAIRAGFRSVHALPMRLRGRTLGALNLFRIDVGMLSESDIVAAQALADVATIAIVQNHAALDPSELTGQLDQALYSRITIEQAKGVMSDALGLDMDNAFRQLRRYARTHDLRLAELALDIADGIIDPRLLGAQNGRAYDESMAGTAVAEPSRLRS